MCDRSGKTKREAKGDIPGKNLEKDGGSLAEAARLAESCKGFTMYLGRKCQTNVTCKREYHIFICYILYCYIFSLFSHL